MCAKSDDECCGRLNDPATRKGNAQDVVAPATSSASSDDLEEIDLESSFVFVPQHLPSEVVCEDCH